MSRPQLSKTVLFVTSAHAEDGQVDQLVLNGAITAEMGENVIVWL